MIRAEVLASPTYVKLRKRLDELERELVVLEQEGLGDINPVMTIQRAMHAACVGSRRSELRNALHVMLEMVPE
jgi:hypothetical protein